MTAGEPTDADLDAVLRRVTPERWDEIRDAAAALAGDAHPGEWAGGEPTTVVVDGLERPATTMPYVIYGEAVLRLTRALAGAGLVVPFDWPGWRGFERYPRGDGLAAAPAADAVRLATTVVRADRFSEGSLLASVEDGTVAAIVDRLQRWRAEHS